jgi:hypothetical protein
MKRVVRTLAIAMGIGLILGGGYVLAAERGRQRVEKVKRELARQAAAHASLRGAKGEAPKDNALCLLCHSNLRDETLAATHLQHGVTCALCHGISCEHMNDETSRTRPDILFGRAEVAPFCDRCHKAHRRPAKVAEFLTAWKGKVRPNGRLILQQAICTDCHGTHVLTAVPVLTPESLPSADH